jgi:hypothetical protein
VSWTGIIRAGQFAAFAKNDATGVACDGDGRPFASDLAATCLLFDSIEEARGWCEAAVQRQPSLRFDIFDADGRVRPPLLTVLHPDRAATLDTSPAQMRRRRTIAWGLMAAGLPLVIYSYVESGEREIILTAFLGINMIVVAGRLLWMNLAIRETERAREARLVEASGAPRHTP